MVGKSGSAPMIFNFLEPRPLLNASEVSKNLVVLYQALFKFGRELLIESDIDRVLTKAMDHIIEISGAERGMIILFDKGGEILFKTARNLTKENIVDPECEVSHMIINKVRTKGVPICLRNALDNPTLRKSKSTASQESSP